MSKIDKVERIVHYGLTVMLLIAVLFLALEVKSLRSAVQASEGQSRTGLQIEWVAQGAYPNNRVGSPYGQFYWVTDMEKRTLTLFGVKSPVIDGKLQLDQDKIGSLGF